MVSGLWQGVSIPEVMEKLVPILDLEYSTVQYNAVHKEN